MNKSSFRVRRHPYEEPHHVQLELFISNGQFSCTGDIYLNVADLGDIGRALKGFPRQVPDEYTYEHGSEDPSERYACHFLMRAYTIGRTGRSGLHSRMNLNDEAPDDGLAEFTIQVEVAQLNRLGRLFLTFEKLQHLEFHWTDLGEELFTVHQIDETTY
jgi:hypothetical protein